MNEDLLQDHFHTLVLKFTGPKTLSQPCNACTLALILVLRGQSKLDLNRDTLELLGRGGLGPPEEDDLHNLERKLLYTNLFDL